MNGQSDDEYDEDEYDDEDEYSNRAGVVTSSGYYVTPEISEEDLDEIPQFRAECGDMHSKRCENRDGIERFYFVSVLRRRGNTS